MSLLKRLSITLFSRLDGVVSDIENHDALIAAAIEEQKKKISAAKVQLMQLKRREKSVEQQLDELQNAERRWQARAVKEAESDRAKALECLKRRKAIEQQIAQLKLSVQEYHLAGEKLAQDIYRGESSLKEAQQKRELLRAKQSSSDVLHHIEQSPGSTYEQMEKSFARWEANLYDSSIHLDSEHIVDNLEQAYLDEENEQALNAELDEILQQQPPPNTATQTGDAKPFDDIEIHRAPANKEKDNE